MKSGFRQSMSGLHTWCGLTCGWLLCAIMLAGTLSVFRDPISRWMQARPLVSMESGVGAAPPAAVTAQALSQAARHLGQHAAGASVWHIELPAHPRDALWLEWHSDDAQAHAALHPQSGAVLPTPWGRATEGGRHFMSFHYLLHADMPGYWLVGWVSMCMLVALISGVVVHRRIFADFFTFRPGKGQRSWLDAHNFTAVVTLPFLFMIVYTGLFIFYVSYMPWPLRTAYGMDRSAYPRFQAELQHHAVDPLERARSGEPGSLVALAPLLKQAQILMAQRAHALVIEQPGDRRMTVRVFGRMDIDGHSRSLQNEAGQVAFDGVTGAVLQVLRPEQAAVFSSEQLHGVIESLHYVRFGGWTMRWLYFLSGLLGTAMVATGTVLFSVKRRQKSGQEFGRATAGIYRAIEALNVAAVAGICMACIGFFYLNRLLPAEMPARALWEIRGFLWIWLASLLHAALRPLRRAWVEQLGAAAGLCLALPLLNAVTTGQHLWHYAVAADWQRLGVELVTLALGVALAFAAVRTQRGWRAKATGALRRVPPAEVCA